MTRNLIPLNVEKYLVVYRQMIAAIAACHRIDECKNPIALSRHALDWIVDPHLMPILHRLPLIPFLSSTTSRLGSQNHASNKPPGFAKP